MKRKLNILLIFLIIPVLSSCRLNDTTGPGSTLPYIYHIGELDTPGFAYAVAVGNNRAYVADGLGGLRIIDVTMPNFPNQVAYFEDEGIYYDVKFDGNDYVFVAAGEVGFKIIDVSSPFGPELVGQFQTENAYGLDFAGNYVYLADDIGGIKILDITNYFNISQISNINVSGQNVNNVTLNWPFLYVAARYGFSIIDISNSFSPYEIAFEPMSNVYDIEIVNHYAYVAYENGLRIYNISQPSDIQELGFWDLPAAAKSVQVRSEFAYLTIGRNGLSIIRVTDPQQPYEIAFYNPPLGDMTDILLYGRYMYIANGEAGFLIMEFLTGN